MIAGSERLQATSWAELQVGDEPRHGGVIAFHRDDKPATRRSNVAAKACVCVNGSTPKVHRSVICPHPLRR
jgi:hypothetical protein